MRGVSYAVWVFPLGAEFVLWSLLERVAKAQVFVAFCLCRAVFIQGGRSGRVLLPIVVKVWACRLHQRPLATRAVQDGPLDQFLRVIVC